MFLKMHINSILFQDIFLEINLQNLEEIMYSFNSYSIFFKES